MAIGGSAKVRTSSARLLKLVPAVLCITAGCAPREYVGVPLDSFAIAPEVRMLARAASRGDKRAQLSLGERFEAGDGVPRDLGRAARLYAEAAIDEPGTQWVYSPRVGSGDVGRMIGLRGGLSSRGLPEARERLERLTSRIGP